MVLFALEDVEVLAFLNAFQCFRTVWALEDSISEITVFGAKQAIAHLAEELSLITVVGRNECRALMSLHWFERFASRAKMFGKQLEVI